MDFSLKWTILAGTNVVHISGIGCIGYHMTGQTVQIVFGLVCQFLILYFIWNPLQIL